MESEKENYIDASLYPRYRVKAGLRNDNGTGVKVGLTKICDVVGYQYIHGKKINVDGKLIYRGYSVQDLINDPNFAQLGNYERIAFLLIYGKLPNAEELSLFTQELFKKRNLCNIDPKYQTTSILNGVQIEVLKLYGQDPNPDSDTLEERMLKGLSILAQIPLITFSFFTGQQICEYPLPNKSLAENILVMARGSNIYTHQEARVMDTLLVLHADHGGGNNSTFANVVISSTGTDIYSCISAAIGSLKGPRHGGASTKVYQQMKEILKVTKHSRDPELMKNIAYQLLNKDFFDKSGLIYGIGHAIYTISDPRCQCIKAECKKLAKEKGQLDTFYTLEAFENAAIDVMKKEKGVTACANVDFYSGFAYSMLGISESLFTPLFCISRTAGWIAHHLENRQSNRKLIRPANVYVGSLKKLEDDNHENDHSI
ncbi:citrate synthase [Faecalitalea cylindroides]|uniref:citrate synthase n=1 Tax=Faecalitalea cylindroides TaxID=39483 RepID=UPI002E76C43E|nr:citrate synthase [Faecalitalea cylindroides]MEE1448637.1 citrate synthase [Faecalitalea cylindroides]